MTDRTMHAVRDSPDPSSIDPSSGDCLSAADPSSRLAAISAVARGSQLLSLLSQQAAAARAEAQCAELRLLLGEARDGEPLRLQRWLKAHAAEHPQAVAADSPIRIDSIVGIDASSSLSPPPANAVISSSPSTETATTGSLPEFGTVGDAEQRPALDNWEALLAPAHARLLGHAQQLRDQQLRDQRPREEPLQTHPMQHRRQLLFSRLRGMVASLAAHGLLIFLLAWITLRLPTPPASLGLDASPLDWTPDAMEISQSMELSHPDAAQESSPTNAPFDLSETLTDVASGAGAALSALPVSATNSLPSGNLLAASSSTSKLMQSNATFYGAAASGNCFCYIIDGSGSMRNGPWDAAKLELLKSLATLKEKQRFYIIFFNCELSAIPLPGEQTPAPAALYATPDNLTHTRHWLDTLRIDRGAPPNDALDMAISKEPDAIYLLTDGVTSVDVPKYLRERNRLTDLIFGEQVRVPIHTIAFYSLDGQAMLKQIASENEGQFIYVPNPHRK